MKFCPNCGGQQEDSSKFCTLCGAPLNDATYTVSNGQVVPTQAPVTNPVQTPYMPPVPAPVEPYATGGLIAWSIITLLLCTIPGIVALVKTCGINSAATAEEQSKRVSSAKTWCTVGTILGVLALIGTFAGR